MDLEQNNQKQDDLDEMQTDNNAHEISINEDIEKLTSECKKNCRLCDREGFPIYLLRKSVIRKKAWNVPWSNKVPEDVAKQPKNLLKEHEYTLRNVRQGYIYVLVESKEGNKEFLGYEVTPEGAFRQRPLENMLINKCKPMSASCIKSNHHIPASFINIDNPIDQEGLEYVDYKPWDAKTFMQLKPKLKITSRQIEGLDKASKAGSKEELAQIEQEYELTKTVYPVE